MEQSWTSTKNAHKRKFYRVPKGPGSVPCSTRWQIGVGFEASDQTTIYRKINEFVKSIRGHCAQTLRPSPYISVFDDIEEAKLLCLSLEDILGVPCAIVEVDGAYPSMEKVKMFKLAHVARRLGQEGNSSFLGVGADTEWLICRILPDTAVNPNFILNGSVIRAERDQRRQQEQLQHQKQRRPLTPEKARPRRKPSIQPESMNSSFAFRPPRPHPQADSYFPPASSRPFSFTPGPSTFVAEPYYLPTGSSFFGAPHHYTPDTTPDSTLNLTINPH